MTLFKELPEASWLVTEPEYRADHAISYSTLSTYAREGIKGLKAIFVDKRKLDTPAIRHGSAVDTLLTEPEIFKSTYTIANYDNPTEVIKNIVDLVWETSDKTKNDLKKVNREVLLEAINTIGYGADNWKEDTKISKIIEGGNSYFQLLPLTASGQKIIHQSDYDIAVKCVDTLKNHHYTASIFNNPNPDIKVYYQLKFKMTYDGKNNALHWKNQLLEEDTIRCMFDIIMVNYKDKTIRPIDLKTTFHDEADFVLSIQDWYYELQATMYSFILRYVLYQDEYFKDFKILPFIFLPINKFSLSPQFYEYPLSIADRQQSFTDYTGKKHLPWYEYLKIVRWHVANQEYRYNMETVLNNGLNKVKFWE